jgi:TRAP-type mannitol/chloroaromatic compound transport system permease small subunit
MSTTAKRPMLAVFADQAGKLSAMVSGLGLLAIAGIICWEVFARYVLNEPTTWVTEIATYILVAVSFLGLAAAEYSYTANMSMARATGDCSLRRSGSPSCRF